MPGVDETAPGPGGAADRPETRAARHAPFQPPGSTGYLLVIPGGDPRDAEAAAGAAGRAMCRARFPEEAGRCRAVRPGVAEYHVLASQPLTLMAYVQDDELARRSGTARPARTADPEYRYAACRDDPRFEDGERISMTLVTKTRDCPPPAVREEAVASRLRAVRAIVLAERADDGDAAAPEDPDLADGAATANGRDAEPERRGNGRRRDAPPARFSPRSMASTGAEPSEDRTGSGSVP